MYLTHKECSDASRHCFRGRVFGRRLSCRRQRHVDAVRSARRQKTQRVVNTTLDLLIPLLRASSLPFMGPLRKRA
jgi:hypothetical protein